MWDKQVSSLLDEFFLIGVNSLFWEFVSKIPPKNRLPVEKSFHAKKLSSWGKTCMAKSSFSRKEHKISLNLKCFEAAIRRRILCTNEFFHRELCKRFQISVIKRIYLLTNHWLRHFLLFLYTNNQGGEKSQITRKIVKRYFIIFLL